MADGRLITLGAPWALAWEASLDTFVNLSLAAAGNRIGWVFQAPEAATITRLGFRHASLAGTPPTYRISLQGVDATGLPDGTVKGGASPASVTFTPTGVGGFGTGTWHWITLVNSFAVARGDFLAVVIDYSSGIIDGTNFSSFTYAINSGGAIVSGLPYGLTDTTGTWAKATGNFPLWGFGSSTLAYGVAGLTATSGVNITNIAEIGMRFLLPAEWGDTFQVVGARWQGSTATGGRLISLTLYSGGDAASPTILQQVEIDTDVVAIVATVDKPQEVYFDEATLTALNFGTAYHIALAHNSAAATLPNLRVWDVNAAADWDAWRGRQIFSEINRAISTYPPSGDDTNAFTNTATRRPMMELILADITEPVGGGGGLARIIGG